MTHSVVIPVYNEEKVVLECLRRLSAVMQSIGDDYELIFVNDGSRDNTLPMLLAAAQNDNRIRVIDFARNFGHQIAITAGLDNAFGDTVTIIDADLQDPPELIREMVDKWRAGYEVVYAKRTKAEGISFFKRETSKLYYKFLRKISDMDMPRDVGDFRLIDKKVADTLRGIREHNRYMRGLITWVGYKQTFVEFTRAERFAGETKYPLSKMLKLAMDGVTSFTDFPLKLATYAGAFVLGASGIGLIVSLIQSLMGGQALYPMLWLGYLLSGALMLLIGNVGIYVSRIMDEVKARPLYIIRKIHQSPQQTDKD